MLAGGGAFALDSGKRSGIVAGMSGNELAVFGLLLLAAGLVHYRFAEVISAASHRLVPDGWDSQPHCQRLIGQMLGFSGVVLFAATTFLT